MLTSLGSFSSALNKTTSNILILPPTNITATNVTSTGVTINFTPSSGAITGYIATTNNGAQGSGTTSPITISGLANNTTYTVTVVAYALLGFSKASASVSFTTVVPYTAGLKWWRYAGYANDVVTYTDTATLQAMSGKNSTGSGSVDFTNIGTATQQNQPPNAADVYTVLWLGYFFTGNNSGTFTFYTNSDDMSYLWIGPSALSGYTAANSTVNNSGLHGMSTKSGTITLSANTYYPIRILFAENGGGDDIWVWFNLPGSSTSIYNGTGYYFTLGGGGDYSLVTTNTGIPSQPTVASITLGSTSAIINFNQPNNVTTGSTYSLFYGSTVYGTATYPATSITASGLAPNTTYSFYFTATNAYGTSIVNLIITTLTSPMFPIYEIISDTSSSILVNIVNIGTSLSITNTLSLLPATSYRYTNTGYLFNITGLSANSTYLLKSIASNPSGASNYALGQLTNTSPLITIASGASTVAFSYYGQYVCAACNGTGIYVSTNYGLTYNSVVSNTNAYSTAISDSGQFMFVGCSNVGQLYYSSNYGTSFTLVTIGANISGIACSTSGANVYAIDYTNGGIYYSINYGMTWSSIVTVAANLSNLSCNFSGYIAYFTSTTTGKAYAYNLFTNSTTLYSPGGVANVSGIAVSANGQYIYVCTYGGLCYTSGDGGASFTSIPIIYLPSSNYQTILCDTTGQYVYLQNNTTSFYYSTNYGATFNTTVFPTSFTRISMNSNSTILGITSGSGVYISTNSIVISTAPGNPFPIVDASFGAPIVTTNSYTYYINSGFATSAGYNYGVSIPGWQISYSNVAIAVANGSNTFFSASMPPATSQAFVLQVNGTYKTPPYCLLYQNLYFSSAGSYTLNFCTIPGSSTSPTYINLTAILGNNSTSNTLTTSTSAWNYVTMPVTIATPGSYSLIFYFSTPNAYLNSAISASVSLTSIGFTVTYLPATNLALTSVTATSAIISFTAAATSGIAAINYTSSVGSGSGTPSAYTITGLSANTTYNVSLIANYSANYYGLGYSLAGSSVASSTVSILTVPATPSLALVSATTSSATIAITDASGSTINSGYTLTTSPSGGSGSGPKSAYVITGLTANTNYTFNVTTNNAAGSSVAATVSASTLPSPPTQLVATTVSDATATVILTPPNGTATITQYTVTSSPGNITASSSSSTITVNGLSANTSYTFTATATNSGGTSTSSSASNSITTNQQLAPPTNLSVTGTTSSTITVSFTPPAGSVNGYILSTINGYQATGTASPITITGLGASTIYTLTIVAVNYNGSSSASSSVITTTGAGNYFSSDGSTLSGWTLGANAISISNTIGNPVPSIAASGTNASYGYYNLGYSFLNTTITFDVYVGTLCNIYFACNSNGVGQMFRSEGRGTGSGFASTTSWTNWNAPPGGTAFSTNRWYSVKIIISSGGVATWYQNNVLQSQSYTIANNGNYFGLQGDGGGGVSYFDNLIIAPTGGGGSSTPTNIGVPNQPIIGTVTTTLNSITVNFTQPTNVAAGSTYSLNYGGTTYGVVNYPATTIFATGLSQNTKYLLNLTATNSFGTSIPSTLITAITPLAGFNIGTATSLTSTGATISFTSPVGAPATTVYSAISGGVTYGTAAYSASSINVTGLSPNTSYTFTVIASTGISTTTSTGTVSITTLASTPSNVTLLSVSDNGASFSFTTSSGTASAITYTITSSPGAITATSSASPIKIVGLSPNTNYTFTMTATNAGGTTPASTTTSTITTGSVPLPPTNLSLASVTSSSITINFTPPVGNVTGFIATDLNGYQGSSTSSPVTISGLTSGTIYTISIVSVDLNGVSSPSSTITATTTDILLSISNFQSTDISGIVVNNNVLYNVYVFKSTGITYNINYTFGNNVTMYVLAVGGGGGGGEGGGGGGGGVVMQTLTVPPGTSSMYVNVGNGGSGPVSINSAGSNGGDTTLSFSAVPSANIVAHGGGGGANGLSSIPASTGGSGGGGDFLNNTVDASGNTVDNNYASDGAPPTYIDDTTGTSGGGGGAGSSATGPNGGSGIQCTLPGISTFSPEGTVYGSYYWGGGGGGIVADGSQDVGNGGNGGAGGGGGGGVGNYGITNYPGGLGDLSGINLGGNALYANGGNGANGTGGGGGGGWSGYGGYGSYGGSGTLILAYSGGGPNTTPTNVGIPTQPVVTSITSTSITSTVTFLPPSNVSSGSTYTLFYGSTTYGTASYPATTILVTGLSPNTTYSLFLTATNAFGTSIPSTIISDTTGLAAPTIGSTSSITASTATISFTAPTGAGVGTSYSAVSGGVSYGSANYPATTIIVTGLSSNTMYTFALTATNSNGTSGVSSTVSFTTSPGSPTSLTATTVSDTIASIAFTPPSGNGTITSYTITSNPGGIVAINTASPITIGGLNANTGYTFTATATNITGTSSASVPSNSITTNSVPNAPTGLIASATASTYITVSFTPAIGTVLYYVASTSTGIMSYDTASPITISGLSASTSYTISVKSVDANGTSVASSSVTASTTATSTGTALTAPVVASVSSVTKTTGILNFVAPSGASTGTSYTAYLGSTVYGGTMYPSTSINVYGLTPNTTYGFTIKAGNQYGYSAASLVLNLATLTLPPTDLSLVTVTSGSVTIGFTPPSGNSTISSFTATDASGIYIATNTVSPVTVTGLNPSTNYNFSIKTTTTVSTYVPSTFNPATVSGMVLWLDASDPYNNGTQPANNASVTTWYDKSGGGRNGTATSGVTYTTNGLNNKPAFSFSGNRASNAYYFCGNVSNTTPYITILAVVSLSSSAGGSGRVLSLSSGNGVNDYNNSSYLAFSKYLGTGIGPNRNNTVLQNNTYTSYSNPYVFETWCDNVNMYTTAQVGNNTTITSTSFSGNFNISYYCVGQNTNGTDPNATFSGYISEIIMFNTALSTSDRQKMEGYLSWKWGLQTNLPSSSPYYASSPTLPSLVNVTGTSVPSSSLAVTTLLAAPTIGTATSITTTGATVSFTPPTGSSIGTTYTISSSSVTYGTVSYPATSFVLNNLASNTTYSFTITATNSVGTSAASTAVAVTTVPGPPSNVSVSISTDTAQNVTFTVPTGSATITNYIVKSSPGNLTGTGVMSPITVTGLSPNTSYTYTITATNSQGVSVPSSPSSAFTTNTLPSPPTGLTASTTAPTYISVSFTPPLGGISYYQASTSTGITSYGTMSPITISGLSPGTSYTITIKTVDNIGTSVASSSITASTTGVSTGTALAAPTITSASSITTTSCVLNFTAPSGAATGTTYVVYVGATVYVSALYPDTSVTIYGLTPNTAYAFTMKASNTYGFSVLSSVLNVATKPLAPTNLSLVSDASSSVTIGFNTVSGNAVISNYTATDASGTYIGTNTTSPITVNGLTSATNYSFTVTATNTITNTVQSTFAPTTITGLQLWLDASDNSTIILSGSNVTQWNDKSGYGRNATLYNTTYSTYNATGFNSKPTINFGSTSCGMYSPMPSGTFTSSSGMSVFAVFHCVGTGSNGAIFTRSYNNVSDPIDLYSTARYSGPSTSYQGTNSTLNLGGITSPSLFSIAVGVSFWQDWLNGSLSWSSTFNTSFSEDSNATKFFLGTRWDKGTNFVGNISEILVYNSILSTTNKQQVEGYLMWKWGIQSNLPSSHPYYTYSPTSPITSTVTSTSVPSSTLAVTTYIGAPTIVSVASITATTAVITFTAPARSAGGTTYSAISGGITYGSAAYPATTITVTGLTSNSVYSFTMTATTSAGTSTPSNAISISTLPGSPQSLVASVYSDTVVYLTFYPPSGTVTITGYIGYSSPGNMAVTGTSSPIIVTGLLPNTTYSFTMTATSSQGTSVPTSPTGYVVTKSLPIPPTNVQVIGVTSTSATISFVPCLGTISYYMATTNTGINTYSTSSPIVVSGLSPSTTYTVTMRTIDQYGTSVGQQAISVTTNSSSTLTGTFTTPSFNYDVNYNVNSSSNNVISWGDTNNAILATAPGNRPVLTSSYLNTYSSIVFTQGTNQVLTTSSLASTALANISSITVFFVMKVPSFNSMENFFSSTGPWAPGSLHLILNPAGYFQISFNSTINDFVTNAQVPLNTPFILMINLGNFGGLMMSYLRLNGIQTSVFTHNPYEMNINTNTLDFGGWSQGSRTINGGISQILIYNRNLQNSEIQQTEYALSVRWNISIYNSILFAPTNFSVSSVSMSSAIISFTPPLGATSGTIYTATANSIIYGTSSYPATTILLANLPSNTTMIFTVTATNAYGTSPASSGLVFTTLPGLLTNLILVSSSTYLLNLSFTPASGQNTVTYSSSIGTGSGTPAAYVVSGLNPATTYTFNIITTNSAGSTNTSITATTALPPPTGLYASSVTTTAATVYFTAPIQVTSDASFSLFISNSFIGSVKYPITSFPLSGLTVNTTYPMTIVSCNSAGSSIPSSVLYLTTLPTAPTNITVVSATVSTIIISFTPPSGNSIVGYSLTSGTGYGTPSAFTLLNLIANSSYTFSIIATNSAGSATSAPVTVYTPLPPPTGLSASSITIGDAIVSFTPPTGAASGTVYTISSGGVAYGTSSYPATTVIATGLSPNSVYSFTITATNGNNAVSVASNSITVTTLPTPPTNLAAYVASNTVALITFTASSGNGTITAYTITSSPGGITTTGTTNSIGINGLVAGTVYTFTVTATNSQGTSTTSSATSPITINPVNTGTITSASFITPTTAGQISIGSISGTYTSFNVTRTGGTQGTFAAIGLTGTAYTDPMVLANNTQYTYTITPVVDGANSDTFTAITNPNNGSTPGSIYTLATVSGLNLTYSGANSSVNSVYITWTNNGYSVIYLANTTKSGARYTATGTYYNSTTNGSSDLSLNVNTQYTYTFTTQNGDGYYVSNTNCQTTFVTCTWGTCTAPTFSGTTTTGTTLACTGIFSGVYITFSGGSATPTSGTSVTGTNSISQTYTGMSITTPYTYICYPVNAIGYTSSNSVTNTVSNPYDGLSSATAAPSAAFLAAYGNTANGVYWINVPTVGATQIYCILDRAVDGGGWMMAMKATRGTTFQYSANYWTTNNTLNPANANRNDGDAKFNTMNYSTASDLLALWPDITTVGGSLNLTNASYSCWSWLQNRFTSTGTFYTNASNNPGTTTVSGITAAMTIIDWFTKISSVRLFIQDAITWPGWKSGIFSSQTDVRFYGFNYTSNRKSRWGFGWNENGGGLFPTGNMGSDDVTGGIGTDNTGYSAGDVIGCCQNTTGINRSARVEIYIRDSSAAPSAPTIGTASKSGSTVTITFTGVTGAAYYTAFSNTGGFSGSSTTSPITITGVSVGTYTFTVKASSASGTSLASVASNSITV